MTIAVTGAGGLLGRAIVDHLRRAGFPVLVLSGSLASSADYEVRRWRADCSWEQSAEMLRGATALVHAAAHIPRNQKDPDEARACAEVNALGTLQLLRASEAAGLTRFIFISGANILRLQERPVHEDDAIGCEHAPYYLGSKVLGEIYVRSWSSQALRTLTLRPSAIYGPGMVSGVFPLFIEQLRSGKPIVLKNGGSYRADFIWRDDVASLVAQALQGAQVGEVNLGSGQAHSLLEVAQLLCEVLNADPRLITVEPATDSAGSAGFSAVDISRAQRLFGFRPVSLKQGLELWLARRS
ncbi:NAD(P)-dependent oxidoreductase [Nordella sp. HKS 07]|uniref:NAD-dependent epimerase/dehydratase family protein n=1 Tax=Nordella sp. HKS 07 TaxID=2712222 RepID=UPI0013E156B0|nr:NAD(P)-dependent oxidoreductase [Nordella sp. HKS 07]QIG49946.1 NAD(P)-dependent oxidoreductase [Nordella sp. HKS 07]